MKYMITNIDEFRMLMNEGLLLTHPLDITLIWMKDYVKKYKNIIFREIKDRNKFEMIIYDYILFEHFLNTYNTIINIYGWFPSFVEFNYYENGQLLTNESKETNIKFLKENWDKLDNVIFTFEAKFDRKIIFENNDKIYHVSPLIYKDKILKYGLTPKTKSKLSYHPERIYFFNDIEYANFLISKLKEKNKENYKNIISKYFNYEKVDEYVLYEITNLNKYTFYNDVNYNKKGVYTLENINPNDIKVVELND